MLRILLFAVLAFLASGCNVVRTEVLVVGGGTAGVPAAIEAACNGCDVVLVEAGGQLGGTMTTGGVCFPGLFHAHGRQIIAGIGWNLVNECVRLDGGTMPDFTKPYGDNHPEIRYLSILAYTQRLQKKSASRQGLLCDIMRLLSGYAVVLDGGGCACMARERSIP